MNFKLLKLSVAVDKLVENSCEYSRGRSKIRSNHKTVNLSTTMENVYVLNSPRSLFETSRDTNFDNRKRSFGTKLISLHEPLLSAS